MMKESGEQHMSSKAVEEVIVDDNGRRWVREVATANWSDGVPAPMDANGCVVPLDTKKLVYKSKTRKVYGFFYSSRLKSWRVCFWYSDAADLSSCTMLDSWDRLEEDVNLGCHDYCGRYHLEECDYNMRVHMLARAKKLAGIEKEARND